MSRASLDAVRHQAARLARRVRPAATETTAAGADELADAWRSAGPRHERINHHLMSVLDRLGIRGGDVLEIGARRNPRLDVFGTDEWDYRVLDFQAFDDVVPVIVGDITDCPHIPDESFDVIISVDVFEHVDRPWLAAPEIARLLRPGGVSYTSTLFSWRYHPVPIDYWRFTPDCLEFLFSDLRTIECDFDLTERRRDIRGKGKRDQVPIDALGGFRENWRVHHVGVKPEA